MSKNLAIDLLKMDGGSQSRIATNEDRVADYAEVLAQNDGAWPFPPIDVFHDGTDYNVADGFHRLLAAHRAKRGSIPCEIHPGTATDARIFGMTANDRHGLPMTRADKRACVEWLLDNGGKMLQADVAAKAGVSLWLVKDVVASRKAASVRGKATPPKQEGEGCFNPGPTSGGGDPFDEAAEVEAEPEDIFQEAEPPKSNGKPGKQYPRSHWFKQWEQAIGPVVRLVDKIAEGVREKHDPHHEAIQDRLNEASTEMQAWMEVQK